MANEISSMIMATMPGPAKSSGRFEKLDATKLPDAEGQVLPSTGKSLPQQTSKISVSTAEIREAVSQINGFVQNVQRDLSFNMDEESGHTVIKVIDSDSGELIRQIPSEEVVALATFLRDARENVMDQGNTPHGLLFSDST